jgi:DNA primase
VIFGEGLTDYLALACAAAGYAVLSAPGTGFAVPAVGRWAIGARVVVAVDSDEAGRRCADELVPALYRQGARDVYRAVWPRGCKDACDVVVEVGIVGLEDFIGQEMQEVRSA